MAKSKSETLKHYHELGMTGKIDARSGIKLIEIATKETLGQHAEDDESSIAIHGVHFYDVTHIDSGTRRSIGKRYDQVPVYNSFMRLLNSQPHVGRLMVSHLKFDNFGHHVLEMTLKGCLRIEQPQIDAPNPHLDDIAGLINRPPNPVNILGELVVGSDFYFGEARFMEPPNQEFHYLIRLGTFQDQRWKS